MTVPPPLFSVAPPRVARAAPKAASSATTAPAAPPAATPPAPTAPLARAAAPAPSSLAVVPTVAAAPATALRVGVAVARVNDGLPMVLDPFAVASRAVLVLIGSLEPAKHIARTAIEMSMEHDSSAAIDVVIPRAIDLVLRRAAHLVSIGAGPRVVDHYTQRLELWRRLARRSGLEPAAIVLTLAPFPIPAVASMLRVPVAEVEACIDQWYAGVDPDDDRPRSLTPVTEQVVDLRDQPVPAPPEPLAPARDSRRHGWRFRVRQA